MSAMGRKRTLAQRPFSPLAQGEVALSLTLSLRGGAGYAGPARESCDRVCRVHLALGSPPRRPGIRALFDISLVTIVALAILANCCPLPS